eukprot:TRINITY_DN16417_c0_g1_i4.p1 TRINITY_DN16417_c0_g1~~TRINITY_DN16417_c0_g1_i4.p1  ORF type:complete len:535 (+),score=185.94 TRINITY_DN16417_c0_g1_i4:42-1646(+)
MSCMHWVTENIVSSSDVLSALNALDDQQIAELLPTRQGRSQQIEITLMKKSRASSVGANMGSSTASTLGYSDDSDSGSTGSGTPPTKPLSVNMELQSVKGSRMGRRLSTKQQEKAAKALQQRMKEMKDQKLESSVDGKPAAVTAAVITFMMAMLSCPLSPCMPPTHLHLSRLPIGTGHSIVIDALRREWPDHEFDIKLHVYQKTRHVSGVAAVTPGLGVDELEAIRRRTDTLYLPLADSGDKMIVEESKRDRDAHLMAKYQKMVLQGLGMEVPGMAPLTPTVREIVESPIVYLRVMGDRAQSNGLLSHVSDIKDEGLIYILDRFPATEDGMPLSHAVRLIAPDKSANRQHMHRSHFGRAYFLECVDAESAAATMHAIQRDSVQNVDGMRFSLHVEMKKPSGSGSGRLFEQDPQKRQHVEKRLQTAKEVVEGLQHQTCGCLLPERHTMAMHGLFAFNRGYRNINNISPIPRLETVTNYTESNYCESFMGDAVSIVGTDYGTEVSEYESYQPYSSGYGFPASTQWWNPTQHEHVYA